MTTALEQRREAALRELMATGTARRGQLSEQYYQHKTADGRTVKHGPYYVWQRWVRGRKVSVRVPQEAIEQVKEDLERGRRVQEVFEDLFDVMEEAASCQTDNSKKKPKRSKTPVCARPMRH